MIEMKTLLPELKKLVTDLSEDLLARSTAKNDPYSVKVDTGLREAYAQIEKGGRTADAFEVWREDYLDQVAVAWVLGCVFVRFMEDNHLIDECWLAGEGAESSSGINRRKLAEDTHELYFREHPHDSDREYFEHVFHEVGKIPACRDLFAEGKTPLWAVGPSGDMAMRLLGFWRDVIPETGELRRGFSVFGFQCSAGTSSTENQKLKTENGDEDPTRFLGDLYQDLSERARKKYALLQTPVFVEEFILDRTLNPAIDEFGLDKVRMIDPTCGSGHFLLGSFARLFDLWIKREDNEVVAAQKALDGVWGCDINPFAVAIARFRLIVAALRACGIKRLKDAPAWNIHLATGDSLLFGSRWDREGKKKGEQQFLGTAEESWAPEIYACEDKEAISEVLGQQYHAVVGNPPYIPVRDQRLNAAYRTRYTSCSGKYSLSVPFAERFFDLALHCRSDACGFVGQITSNSFMKREFGKTLIEEFLPSVDLTHVLDTSGAYIPGHGTPTVILFGRNRPPQTDVIRAVLGIAGEPSTPSSPSLGVVWQSIMRHIDAADSSDSFTSSADVPRAGFSKHPWSIGGGGAAELKERIDGCADKLLQEYADIGVGVVTLEDDVYHVTHGLVERANIPPTFVRGFVVGDTVRDWAVSGVEPAVFPHEGPDFQPRLEPHVHRFLWPYKVNLSNRTWFRKTQIERGLTWYGYGHISAEKFRTPLALVFAEVATHNHFALDRGGRVFKQTAPIIKLKDGAGENEYLSFAAFLNSSVACFWLKQVAHNKGDSTDQHGARTTGDPAFNTYAYNSTLVGRMPVVESRPVELAMKLDRLAQEYAALMPDKVFSSGVRQEECDQTRDRATAIRSQMIALQEEIDWRVYSACGIATEDYEWSEAEAPLIQDGQRAFEIVLARRIARNEERSSWFERHGSKPITEIPAHWPELYRKLVERRIELIETNKEIGLIERPEYKRRWNSESWENQQQRALKNWLLDRLEGQLYWPNPQQHEPRLQSVAELSDKASGDHDFLQVAAIYRGREDFDIAALVAELVGAESVPFLPVLRYKPAGLRKREVWEKTWELQRKEDAGEDVGEIKVPPKYALADFQSSDYWRLRGKLDVPKERWISFPHCETESDPSLVVGWAGWNHLQQATALIAYYDARKREGWDAKRLTPLLAGLDQLLPWIHQWHPEIDPEFGETAGQSFETMLKADAHELGLTLEDIRAWEPPKTAKGKRKRKTK